jgi:hypothetical protein
MNTAQAPEAIGESFVGISISGRVKDPFPDLSSCLIAD